MQPALRLARVPRPGLLSDKIRIEVGPGADLGFALLGAGEKRLDKVA